MAKMDGVLVEIGARVRHARLVKGLTQESVAEAARVTAETVSRIERGVESNPTLKLLMDVGAAVGLEIHDLLEGDERHDTREKEKLAREFSRRLQRLGRREARIVRDVFLSLIELADKTEG
ncbi:MAG: helix-turn-helix transcriptional regulator [Nitrospirae bacterium]|nr:helix-turn-helix transcriptional regulator [Nitrospirota bacterium]